MKWKTRGTGWRVLVAIASVVALAVAPSVAASADDPGNGTFTVLQVPSISPPTVNQRIAPYLGQWSPTPSSYGYQWYLGDEPIAGATASTYTPTADEQGQLLSVALTANLAGYNSLTVQTATSTIRGEITNTGAIITGTVALGQTVTVDPGTFDPPNPTVSYRWTAINGGATLANGPDATSLLLTDAAADGVRLTISASQSGYANAFTYLTTPWFTPDKEIPGGVYLSGVAQQNHLLTATVDPSTWNPTNLGPISYQWYRNGQPIPGATQSTYLVVAADVGTNIWGSATAAAGDLAPATNTTAGVDNPIAAAVPMPIPTITGTAQIGVPLEAHIPASAPATQYGYAFQWYVNGVRDDAYNENGQYFYPDSPDQVGARITVSSVSYLPGGTVYSDPSAPTAPVKSGVIHPVTVQIWGDIGVADTVQPLLSDVIDANKTSYTVYVDNVAVSTNVPYVIKSSDWHHSLWVVATESLPGWAPVVTRSKTYVVGNGDWVSFPDYVAPLQIGVPAQLDLAASDPVPTGVSVQWRAGNQILMNDPVIGYGTSFSIPAKYAGHYVYAIYNLTGTHMNPVLGYITDVERVKYGVLPAQAAASVVGPPLVGAQLTASGGSVATAGAARTYQWYSAGSPSAAPVAISGARSASYVPTAAMRGRVISVRVTVVKTGYSSESTFSSATLPLLLPSALVARHGTSRPGQPSLAVPVSTLVVGKPAPSVAASVAVAVAADAPQSSGYSIPPRRVGENWPL